MADKAGFEKRRIGPASSRTALASTSHRFAVKGEPEHPGEVRAEAGGEAGRSVHAGPTAEPAVGGSRRHLLFAAMPPA
ncbi:hypothetical protein ABIG06_003891 [Bradyrhizobium sp. USDA 326]|uniref:hypothetical protein n=1 Tax=unclassified Bradyrhizobium TaxID=2631580 RepID=UPI001FE05554|nr:hypothetical protein [Bradyrhizobium sp. RP6]